MKKIFFLLLTLLALSCKKEKNNASERFDLDSNTEHIDSELQWNFSNPNEFTYDFEQQVHSISKFDKTSQPELTHTVLKGILKVSSQGNNLGEFSLTQANSKITQFDKDGKVKDTISQIEPDYIIQNISANSTSKNNESLNALYNFIFPLPNIQLKEGKVDQIQMKIPLNVRGNKLYSSGSNTLTYIGEKEYNGETCSLIEGDIKIDRLSIPEDLEGDFECTAYGNALYYFSKQKGCFIACDVKVNMNFLIHAPATNEKFSRAIFSQMTRENSYRVRLIDNDSI